MRTLFDDPPAQRHSETSVSAAKAIAPAAATLRLMVLEALRKAGADGLTDEEMLSATGLQPSTGRPRRIELMQAGHVRDSGRKRETRSGRNAVVWVANTFEVQE